MDSDLYGGGESVVNKVGADYNSFNGRDALYSIQYYGTIPNSVSDADGIAFIQGMKAAIEDNQPQTFFKEYGMSLVSVFEPWPSTELRFARSQLHRQHVHRRLRTSEVLSHAHGTPYGPQEQVRP